MSKGELEGSGFTNAHLSGVKPMGWRASSSIPILVRDALAAGVAETGTTIHWVDSGVDTGPIIAQENVEISPSDTEATLHERIKIVERRLYVETLRKLLPTLESANV